MDLYVSNLIQGLRAPAWDGVMLFFTYLGDWPIVVLGVLIACVLFAVRRQRHRIVAVLISVGGGEILVWIIKHIVQRPRPSFDILVYEKSFSFPSGHAFAAVAFYGFIFYILSHETKKQFWKIIFAVAGALLAFAIGFSRIYLGVHWPSDVLAGFALGAIWLAIIIAALKKYFIAEN